MTVDTADLVADIDGRLKALDLDIAAKRKAHRSTILPALAMPSAAKDRDRLRGELDSLLHNRDELAEAMAEAQRQAEANARDDFIAQQHARKLAAHKARCEANATARQAATDLGAAATAFIKASVVLHGVNGAVSPTAHEQLAMLPRRVLRALAQEMVACDLCMHNFKIEDGVDHWEPSLSHIDDFLRSAAEPRMS
jgi:hypothetical protein